MKVWWFTGLSGSGKTTTANALKEMIPADKCIVLDGDILREGLCGDLGFSKKDREENLRRVSHLAKIFWDEGYSVICSFVSPTEKGRQQSIQIMRDYGMDVSLVWFSTPLEECEKRDVKGLYKRARAGEIKDFTGIGQPYEEPLNADLIFDTSKISTDEIISIILQNI
jgi:adenylyl-sulfate kinase